MEARSLGARSLVTAKSGEGDEEDPCCVVPVQLQCFSRRRFPLANPNTPPVTVRKPQGKAEAAVDPRVRRSTRALGTALVELLHEREFDSITVQDVLDRAGVGRATFYAHYRNKEDVLYSAFENVIALFHDRLDHPSAPPGRLVPVAEFLTHIGEVDAFASRLRASGKFEEMMSLLMDSVARSIEERIAPAVGTQPAVPPRLLARMLAAAFIEMLRWWTEQRDRAAPAQMDATFHVLAGTAMRRERYDVRAMRRSGPAT